MASLNKTAACPNVARIDRPPAWERTQASLGHGTTAALRRLRECALGARIWPHFRYFSLLFFSLTAEAKMGDMDFELRDENLTA